MPNSQQVGFDLKKPCFSHGQLYVRCLRTRLFNSLFFKINKHSLQGITNKKCYKRNVIQINFNSKSNKICLKIYAKT